MVMASRGERLKTSEELLMVPRATKGERILLRMPDTVPVIEISRLGAVRFLGGLPPFSYATAHLKRRR